MLPGFLLMSWNALPAAAQPFDGSTATLIAIDANGAGDGSASADGRFIAASSTRLHGQSAIWLFDRQTGNWRQLTEVGNGDREPAVSPDGRFVIFVSDRNGQTDLWAVWKARNFFTIAFAGPAQALATPRSVLHDPGHVGACHFKADGKLICHVYEGNAGDLLEIDPQQHSSRTLTKGGWWYYKPDVSPDGWIAVTVIGDEGDVIRFLPEGSRGDPLPSPSIPGSWPQFVKGGREIVYHRQISEGTGLKLLDLRTGQARDLRVDGKLASFAALSPNGRFVAYCRKDGKRSSVRVRSLDTQEDRALPLGREACNPAWSPQGDRLAVSLRDGDHWAQAIVRADGSGLRVLLHGTSTLWQLNAPAAWSPDGRKIAFAATTAPYESDLFVADIESGAVRNITGDAWYDEGPSWSADGKSIVFMSTRGGNWTWGLFAISATGGSARVLVTPGPPAARRHSGKILRSARCIVAQPGRGRTYGGPAGFAAESGILEHRLAAQDHAVGPVAGVDAYRCQTDVSHRTGPLCRAGLAGGRTL
ncbi:MAG: hypothetical protein P8Y48_09770 [Novosphingobium sp.]